MISLDTETTGVDLKHGVKPFLVTTCNNDLDVVWWEWDVDPLTRNPIIPEEDLNDIEEMITQNDGIVMQNSLFDIEALTNIDCQYKEWDWNKTDDTLIAGHLINSAQPHDLTTMAMIYLGVNLKPYDDAMKEACKAARRIARSRYRDWRIAKADLPEMPSAKGEVWKYDLWLPRAVAKAENEPNDHPWFRILSEYANADSAATRALWNVFEDKLHTLELSRIYESRMNLLPMIRTMEGRGVHAGIDRIEYLKGKFEEESEQSSRVCVNLADNEIEKLPAGTSNNLKHIIFDKFGLESSKKSKKTGNPSMDKSVLEEWSVSLPERSKPKAFIDNLIKFRKRKTALSYIKSYEKFAQPYDENSIILFPRFNPTGTHTLRWTSQNPNAQQISKQQGVGLRYAFGPAKGREWWSLDYDNLELRIPAYESEELEMVKLFENPDEPPYYGSNHLLVFSILHPDKWNHDDPEGLLKAKKKYASTWYQWTKNGNFAVQYGAVKESGTADAAYHVKGGQAIIEKRFRNIGKLNQSLIKQANEFGFVETIPDVEVDPCRGYPLFMERDYRGSVKPTLPLNFHVQGTACWVTSMAMIDTQKMFDDLKIDGYIIMNVHDEIVIDLPYSPNKGNKKIATKVRKIMEYRGKCIGINLTSGMDYHPINWGESE